MSAMRRRAIAVLAGVVVFAWWVGFDIGGARVAGHVDNLGELVAALVAAVACGTRTRRETGSSRRGWALLAASSAVWGLGQAVWTYYDLFLGVETPFPSVADIGFLAAVPLGVAGLLCFGSMGRRGSAPVRMVLDSLLVACSVLFVSWAVVLGPVYRAGEGSALAQVLSLAYPLGDVMTITVVVLVAARLPIGAGRRSMGLVAAGLLAIAVSDSAFAYLTQLGTFGTMNVLDTGWFAGFLLIALGATCRPTAGEDPWEGRPSATSRAGALFPYVPGAVALAAGLVTAARGDLDRFLTVDGFVLLGLLGARQYLSLMDNVSLSRELEAKVEARTSELREREARFAALVRRSSDLVSIVTPDGTVLYQSPSIEKALGHSADSIIGSDLTRLVHPDDRARWRSAVAQMSAQRDGPVVLEWRMWHADGSWHVLETTVSNLLDEPSVQGLVLNARDITERNALEEQLRHNAFHDPLTGLANRALFRDRLEHALAASRRHHRAVAVLFVDLDDFKAVNDGNGHDAGDELLVCVADRLRTAVRQSDTIARLGGDEFAILLEHADGESEAVRVAGRVLAALEETIDAPFGPVAVRASLGIATALAETDAEELMRNADVAMYAAKSAGKGRFEVFRPAMHEALVNRLQIEADLRVAVDGDQMTVYYQPIVALETGAIVAVEALLRWRHPTRGLVGPNEFIPVAEATGLIVPIGDWLFRTACAQVAGWTASGIPLSLSVNLSARQLNEPGLVVSIREALASSGVDPGRLTLEITESMLLDGAESVMRRFYELKAMGVRLSIDDFGTGYSSLAYLQRLPVDEVKIDRSFVSGILSDTKDAGVVETIVSLARNFHLETVAEGVEWLAQASELRSMGCSRAQGFLMAQPMPAAELAERLTRSPILLPVPADH